MKNVTRTAAATTEQVISTGRCVLHAILPELTTTGVVTARNDSSAVKVAQVAGVVATAGAAGALDDDEYFVKVVAVDRHGDTGTASTEDSDTTTAGAGLGSVSVAFTAQAAAVSYRVYVGQATNTFLGYFTATASPFVITSIAQAAFEAGGAWTDPAADAPAATTGETRIKIKSAIALTQAGKLPGGALFENGLVIEQSVSTDRCAIVWEAV
jgi:hypothetical protein